MSSSWTVQKAGACFSQMLEACLVEGPQRITRHGQDVAVLVSITQWRDMQPAPRPGLKQLLLSPGARMDLLLPVRGRARRRMGDPGV